MCVDCARSMNAHMHHVYVYVYICIVCIHRLAVSRVASLYPFAELGGDGMCSVCMDHVS